MIIEEACPSGRRPSFSLSPVQNTESLFLTPPRRIPVVEAASGGQLQAELAG
jgi:hypothetical protein